MPLSFMPCVFKYLFSCFLKYPPEILCNAPETWKPVYHEFFGGSRGLPVKLNVLSAALKFHCPSVLVRPLTRGRRTQARLMQACVHVIYMLAYLRG